MENQVSRRRPRARATELTPPQPGLLSLPQDALLLITQQLSTRDRAFYSGSSSFWASIELAPATAAKEAESLLTWLGPRRSAIKHLKITQTPQAESDFRYADGAWMQFDPDKYGCLVQLLGQLAGGRLESLNWIGSRFLNSWAFGALPRLRNCDMVASSECCTSRLCSRFSQLSELRRLSLSAQRLFIDWEPGCLPSSLEELTLKTVISCQRGPDQDGDPLTAVIAASASHATRLASLTLLAIQAGGAAEGVEEPPFPMPVGSLNRLAQLTHLTLSATGPMPGLAPLAALSALQKLQLGFEDGHIAQLGGQLQALTSLRQLTSIAIHDPGLAELPCSIDALWHFPTLKAVSLVGSPVVRRLAEALDGSSIEMLTLRPDSVVAMRRCRLPLLRTLEIDNFFKAGEETYSSDDEGSARDEEESEAEGSDGE